AIQCTVNVTFTPSIVGTETANLVLTDADSTSPQTVSLTGIGTNIAPPDLAIAKTHTGSFTVGSNGVYSIVVSNVGNTATSGAITVSDTLPAGLGFVSGTGPGWACTANGHVVTCNNAGPLNSNASSTITLTVSVGAGAVPSVTNTASVATTGDSNNGNNSSSDLTTVNALPVGQADLTLTKHGVPKQVKVGHPLHYLL